MGGTTNVQSEKPVPSATLNPKTEAVDLEAQRVWKGSDLALTQACGALPLPEDTEVTATEASGKARESIEEHEYKIRQQRRLWNMGYVLIVVSLVVIVIAQVLRGSDGRPGKL